MEVFHSIIEYRAWRKAVVGSIGYVASLGCLHEGHRSLMRQAREENDHVVVSLYVNPLQFAANEDFAKYPRDPAADTAVCADEEVSALLLLRDEEMYPKHFGTKVVPTAGIGRYEAASRPDHFTGVATVVTKLLQIVRPDRSYWGLKDYQQLLVVRRLNEDLNLGVEIVAAQTIREPDGLAMSSRNAYLSKEERRDAPTLYRALREVHDCYRRGVESASEGLYQGLAVLKGIEVPMTLDYFDAVNPDTLEPVDVLADGVVVIAAVRLPSARMIDNIILDGGG